MIYLDCAATSLQKPKSVYHAVRNAMLTMASPGRGGYKASMLAAETVFYCRSELAALFHVPAPEQVVFTFYATHGLNIAINDLVDVGDKVVVSGYEHNSVMRPLYAKRAGVRVVRSALFDDDEMIEGFASQLPGAKAAICTAMSNVFGYITPVQQIVELCSKHGVPLIVDASQLAGCGEVDFEKLGAAYIAFPGHKGLLGPQGTGVLLCGKTPKVLLSGGSGSESRRMEMSELLPDRLEAGTHNVPGIAGLLEGVRFVRRKGVAQIAAHERRQMERFHKIIADIDGLETFFCEEQSKQGGVLSVCHKHVDSELFCQALGELGIAVRGGLHCAPFAHETVGTLDSGTVRFSFSPFITDDEIKRAAQMTKASVNKQKT